MPFGRFIENVEDKVYVDGDDDYDDTFKRLQQLNNFLNSNSL